MSPWNVIVPFQEPQRGGSRINPKRMFFPFKIVPSQEFAELFLIRHGAVMLFLDSQVCLYLIDVGITYGEGAITILPLKSGSRNLS
jgi:hypothetical protein